MPSGESPRAFMHAKTTRPTRGAAPSQSFPMHSGILFIGVLSLICWAIQLLPVISVPITGNKTNYVLNLSHYNNVSFGVFGVCDTVRHTCSSPQIGYKDDSSITYPTDFQDPDPSASLTEVQLPSNVTHLVSKLLVLHVMAFAFTCLLVLQSISLFVIDTWGRRKPPFTQTPKKWRHFLSRSFLVDPTITPSNQPRTSSKHMEWRNSTYRRLTCMFVFAILSFISSLLAFLADFVLFVPKLGPLGWIQMLPVSIMAFIASFSCFLKRSILSRRHLDDSVYVLRDMRSKHSVFVEWDEDTHTDDGVFIYSNGFTNEQNCEEQQGSLLSTEGEIRHTHEGDFMGETLSTVADTRLNSV